VHRHRKLGRRRFIKLAALGTAAPGFAGTLVRRVRGDAPPGQRAVPKIGIRAASMKMVGHPAVRVYYDPHNMAYYGHADQAIPGIKLLGRQRICTVHVKNGDKLIDEPGPIDWAAAFRAFNEIGYDGWYIYETAHRSTEDCIEDTKKNNAFLRRHVQAAAR
jgi:hypothetical protein